MSGKRILITGATGFVGYHLVNTLLKNQNNNLAIVSRSITISQELFGKKVTHIIYESSTFKSEIVRFKPQVVIHLASYSTSQDDLANMKILIDSNILFISVLLDALKEVEVELFLNTGSFSEYYYNDGKLNPAYYYSATKTASRSIVNYYKNLIGMKCCTIVPYTIYGETNKNKKIMDLLFDSLESQDAIEITNGNQVSDFIHLNDVVAFYIHILNNMELLKDNEEYHLGTGEGNSIRKIAKIVENVSGMKTNVKWGALEYRRTDMMRAIAPIYKLERELHWSPSIDINEGVRLLYLKKFCGEDND
jgi:nucleoside-diphosphate-sugar epimerase